MRALIERYAVVHDIPEALLHRVIQRESDYRADARAGPYWGLMQILPQTARTMGFRGDPSELLDPEVNLTYAGRYLGGRGSWPMVTSTKRSVVRARLLFRGARPVPAGGNGAE
jgi:soluble lytic murein transglycosylase-like protein